MAQSHRPAKVVTPTVLTRSQSDDIIINLDRNMQSTCSMKGGMKGSTKGSTQDGRLELRRRPD